MKKFTIDKSKVKTFEDFQSVYSKMEECTPEEEKEVLEKIQEYLTVREFDKYREKDLQDKMRRGLI